MGILNNWLATLCPTVIPPVPERFQVVGERTHCVTGEKRNTLCIFEVQERDHGKILQIVEGGVTGHESLYILDASLMELKNTSGWTACAGTKNRWDRLHIGAEHTQALMTWARSKL